MGLASALYSDEFAERVAPNYHYGVTGGSLYWWEDLLYPFLNTYDVYTCPSHVAIAYASLRPAGTTPTLYFSYVRHSTLVGNGSLASSSCPTLGQFATPSATANVVDVISRKELWSADHVNLGHASYGIDHRHNQQFNLVYFDGHAGASRTSNATTRMWMR